MAIITTTYSIGWFGTATTSGEDSCIPYNLTKRIGTYSNSSEGIKSFQRGTDAPDSASEQDLSGLVFIGYTSSGAPQIWGLDKEKEAFYGSNSAIFGNLANQPNRNNLVFSKNDEGDAILACGRMYIIINNNNVEIDIPGFIPSADGVDMGRIDTTITG